VRQNGVLRSGLLAAAGVAAGAFLLGALLPDSQTAATVVAALACGLAALAAVLAFAAWRRASANETNLLALARAFDQAGAGNRSTPLDLDAIAAVVRREVGHLASARADDQPERAAHASAPFAPPLAGNVEPLIRNRPRKPAAGKRAVIAQALADGRLDLALRPVVSLAQGAPVAFDAFAEFIDGAEPPFHLDRLQPDAAPSDRSRFETLLLGCAIEATRRVVAGAIDAPLHVRVSRAVLETADDGAIARLRAHPRAAHSIVLDLAASDLGTPLAGLDALLDAGVGLCLDLAEARTPDLQGIRMAGARHVRLPASRLLGHTAARGTGPSGAEIAAAARDAGIAVIADDVANDDEALGLVDLGIDLMSGPRFSGPRRLRDMAGAHPSRTAAE
jgi:cyclic-di-GMP phosphodiesterase TipF (flagellum assembly factor)